MPTGYNSNLTEEVQKELIEFYLLPNTLNTTAKQFSVTVLYVKKLLHKFNILEHSKAVTFAIRNMHSRETCLKKYGVENVFASDEIKEKIKLTNLEKYGDEIYFRSDNFKIKSKEKALLMYGVDYFSLVDNTKEKIKETNNIRYGGNAPACSKAVRDKMQQTMFDRYGTYHALQSDKILQSMQKNNLIKFGCKQVLSNNDVRNKIKLTNLNKYGVENVFAALEIRDKIAHISTSKYMYKNVIFDSFPELCFYLYHIEHNIDIIREPIQLKYIVDGVEHAYYPDFRVRDLLYELKGDLFLMRMAYGIIHLIPA